MNDDYGAQWLRSHGKTVSPLGERVASLINWLYRGIYHQDRAVLKADWSDDFVLFLTLYGSLSTFDNDSLTRLVVGAHDRALRVELAGVGPRYMRLMFHGRSHAATGYWERHPTIEQAIETIRQQPVSA